MNKLDYQANLIQRAALFKALGHPARLLIINLVRERPRHTEELAAILGLTPATVSHHLSGLTAVGLLASQKDGYYQMYALAGNLWEKTMNDIISLPQPQLGEAVEQDAYQQKVLRAFFKNGRLTQIPAQQKKRLVVLEYLLQEFEPGRDYEEREVNAILFEFNDDVATLRREMIDNKLMTRAKGIYTRLK
jgi:DNA-binding transcriptional ArsR family regulator